MLEVLDLAARRGNNRLFAGLSFRAEPGEALTVTGANGTGKTTLLRMLAGLSMPESGEIRWEGRAVQPFDSTLRAASAFVGHHTALKDELTTEENLASMLELAGLAVTPEMLRGALDTVALSRQRTLAARVLSQGQRRRIGLARLTLLKRRLWILDEPVTALDAEGVALLARLIGEHLDEGGLAIAATHAPLGLPAARARSLKLS